MKNIKTHTVTLRVTEETYNKLKRACCRDELKVGAFAHDAIVKAMDKLIAKQEKNGFKCLEPV